MRLLVGLIVASCASERLAPRRLDDGVVAEVHLHQYRIPFSSIGSHAAASFVDKPVPFRDELDEMIVHVALPPVMREGPCRLDVPSICAPTCQSDREYCNHGKCEPFTPLTFLDHGPVTIAGGSHGEMKLAYSGGTYRSGRSSLQPIFAEGDRLTIATATFTAHAIAPAMPVLETPLVIPDGAYELRWARGEGQIAIRLTAVSPGGAAAFISCLDDDKGAMTIPASLIARLPRAPRTLQLDVERRNRQRIRLPRGHLAVVTVASTLVSDRSE